MLYELNCPENWRMLFMPSKEFENPEKIIKKTIDVMKIYKKIFQLENMIR